MPAKWFESSDLNTKSISCRREKIVINSTIEHLSTSRLPGNDNVANEFIVATTDNQEKFKRNY